MRLNKQTVLQAMEIAGLAYAQTQPMVFGRLEAEIDDPATGIQCFVRRRGEILSIAFRGSDAPKDWRTNLAFCKKVIPYNNSASKIKVHAGFIRAYKEPQIRERLQALVTPGIRRVELCGHSYGAALAVLCAVDLQYNFPDRDFEVMLFGCPRVGNRAFQRSYNRRVFKTLRVENGNDIVSKLPPALWGYRHVGIRIHVGAVRLPGVISVRQHHPQAYYASAFTCLPG